ncbi:unnamed protein product [Closterium sp. NIES-54]
MHNGASRVNRLRAPAYVRTAVFYECNAGHPLCCSIGTLSTYCVGRSRFCSAGAAPLRNAGRRLTMLFRRKDHHHTAARSTGSHHLEGGDGTLAGGRRDEGLCCAISARGQGWAARGVSCLSPALLHGHLKVLLVGGAESAQVVSRATGCWSPGVEIHPVDVPGDRRPAHRTAGGADDTPSDGRAGVGDGPLQPCSADPGLDADGGRRILAASYITHIVKGLPRSYNLMKRMMMVPSTRESLDEDSLTNYVIKDEALQEAEQPTELLPQASYKSRHQGQRGKPGGGGSGGGRSTKDVDEKRSTRDKVCGSGSPRRECWICHDPDHLSFECPNRDDSDKDDNKGWSGRSASRRPRRDENPRKKKQTSKTTSSTKDVDSSSGKGRGDGEASCSMVGVVEPTISLAPEVVENFQAVAAAVQANPMGTKAVFVDMALSGSVKHVPSQLKESGVQMQGDGDEMLLITATGEVLGRAHYTTRVLRPCSTRSPSTEVVALRTIALATNSTPDRWHARLGHVGVETIKSSAKHEVATGFDIKLSSVADPSCVSCVGGKVALHTFPDKGSDAEEALAVVHFDLCGPFWVAAKDGSLYFLLLKDRHTRFVWVVPVAKKSDVLREFQKCLVLVERQTKNSVLMLRSDWGGEFLVKDFTNFNDGKGIVHDLTCPYTPQHWWHLALR